MSLLMDALRKAEEAKKKAARESNSEEATPVAASESQQASAVPEKVSEDSAAPKIELSMEAIEELPKRSAVPTLDTNAEFEDDDEEDYVLPTSIGTPDDANLHATQSDEDDAKPGGGQSSVHPEADTKDPEDALEMDLGEALPTPEPELEQEPEPEPEPERPIEPLPAHAAFDLDSFESEEESAGDAEQESASSISPPALPVGEKSAGDNPRVVVKVAERARERARDREEPQRRTARNVFAAKRTSLLKNPNLKGLAGGALALVVLVFGIYFYISLNEESTFNVPAGSYVATEFVDSEFYSDTDEQQLEIDADSVAEVDEAPAINSLDVTLAEQSVSTASVDGVLDDSPPAIEPTNISVEPTDTSVEPPVVEVATLPVASRGAADLQPEVLQEELSPLEVVATTIGDTPEVEPERVAVPEPQVVSEVTSPAVTAEPTNLISFRRQEAVSAVDPSIGRAYTAYQQGSIDQAEALYRQTLSSDPLQRDALLGLATIAARRGNSTEALDLYSRLLARNPSDPIARAGLMELLPAGSPSEQEAELKRLLNDHPNIAALSYAYGNFLSSNQRWSEAQQAYFRALQLAKADAALTGLVNPDYAFNLAVSLEHLDQIEPAQNYYREALVYSENHPAGFDLAALRGRLASMSGNSNND